jgi:superfamily I DNA/RNA helicase
LLNKKIYWVGGIDGYNLQDIEDMYHFSRHRRDLVRNHRLIDGFRDFDQYKLVASETGDSEMLRTIKILERYQDDLPEKLNQLRLRTVTSEFDADVTVSTAHRCKGLEWDYVELESDFNDILDMDDDAKKREDEINLLYVAATRAMKCLAINDVLDRLAQKFSLPVQRKTESSVIKPIGDRVSCNI